MYADVDKGVRGVKMGYVDCVRVDGAAVVLVVVACSRW